MLQRLRNALASIEYPNVVLLLPGSPELFDRSKTASTVDQFVSKGDPRFTIGTLDSPPGYQLLSFPPKVRQRRHSVLGGADVAPVRLQLVLVLQGPLALTNAALYRKVGSRCSIRTTPLCTAAAPGLRVLACRFSVHSPEKSGFCCETPKPASARRIALAIYVRINIRALLNRQSICRYYRIICGAL